MDLEWSKTYVQYIGDKIIVFSPFRIKGGMEVVGLCGNFSKKCVFAL